MTFKISDNQYDRPFPNVSWVFCYFLSFACFCRV